MARVSLICSSLNRMSKITVSPIEDIIELEAGSHDEIPNEIPIGTPVEIQIETPAPKPKRVRKKTEPPTEPPPPPTHEPRKGKLINCSHCGKQMLEKTLKYYHQLKCSPKENIPEQVKPAKPENITVDFGFPPRRVKML